MFITMYNKTNYALYYAYLDNRLDYPCRLSEKYYFEYVFEKLLLETVCAKIEFVPEYI